MIISAPAARVTYQELNVMLKGSMSVSDKVGCFPLAICFQAEQEWSQVLKATLQQLLSHCCCCQRCSGKHLEVSLQLSKTSLEGNGVSQEKMEMILTRCKLQDFYTLENKSLPPALPPLIYLFWDYFCSHGFPLLLH